MLKICVVAQYLSRRNGGISEAVKHLFRAVDSQDFNFTAICAKDEHLESDRQSFNPARIIPCWMLGRRFGFSVTMVFRILKTRSDVIHVHGIWTFHALAAWIASVIRPCRIVISPHGMLEPWILNRSRFLKYLVTKLYLNRLFMKASFIHALNVKERDEILGRFPRVSVRVIPNYVDVCDRSDIYPSWWVPEFTGKNIFLFFGRLHTKKGCAELCEGWTAFCHANPGLRSSSILIFCGWNDGIENFDSELATVSAECGNAFFFGPQYGEEKARTLSRASALILPSKSEGLPIAILEGWAMGIPALITQECNLPEGFEFGAAVQISSDVGGIARGIEAFAKMPPSERNAMSSCARALMESRFSKAEVGRLFEALYIDA